MAQKSAGRLLIIEDAGEVCGHAVTGYPWVGMAILGQGLRWCGSAGQTCGGSPACLATAPPSGLDVFWGKAPSCARWTGSYGWESEGHGGNYKVHHHSPPCARGHR